MQEEYIVWVPVPCHIPHVVKATGYKDARRVIAEALEAGTLSEVSRELTSHIKYDGWDGDPEEWDVVRHDDYFSAPVKGGA